MKTLYIYNLDGSSSKEPIDCEYDIFRKEIDVDSPSGATELEIAKRLLKCPMPNIVCIYDVQEGLDGISWIDMEYLDDTYKRLSTYVDDLKSGLEQLHTIGVVYIDIKSDNIGYSSKDNKFKIFDFDCSGIVDIQSPTKWEREPFHDSFKYKVLKQQENNVTSLYELDELAFQLEYKHPYIRTNIWTSLYNMIMSMMTT